MMPKKTQAQIEAENDAPVKPRKPRPTIDELLVSPQDKVRHMVVGDVEVSYQKSKDTNGWLVERGEDGEPVWTRVKWTFNG